MDYDVAVIGCGPVGALAANLLGRARLRTLVVERETHPHPLPRAVHMDHEMMRLFQAADVVQRIVPAVRATEGNLHVGADHQVIRYVGSIGQPQEFGWAGDYFFYQPEIEAQLRAALVRYPQVQLRLGTRVESLHQDPDAGVSLALRQAAGTQTVSARWVIACDGASSPTRKALGIDLDDLGFDEPWLVVDADAYGAVRFPPLTGLPPGVDLQRLSVMMCDPARPTTVVPGRGTHRRWEFMLLPGEDEQQMMQPARVATLLAPWLQGVAHRILRATTYRFHGLIARRWQAGSVFLAGDAAHQTPPFFGQGMCHGMRDVANLVWKLALVAGGHASAQLLRTYQGERERQVREVIATTVEAGRYICILDRAAAQARDAVLEMARHTAAAAPPFRLIPPLRTGVIATGTPAAGERFIQPWLRGADGSRILLDDAVGGGWRLFVAGPRLINHAQALAAGLFPALPLALIDIDTLDAEPPLAAWFERHRICAVLVRPDCYVFGGAHDAGGLTHLLDTLSDLLEGALHATAQH